MATTVSVRHSGLSEQHAVSHINMELVPNPHFTFPAQPAGDDANSQTFGARRPASMHSLASSYHNRPRALRQSASALPTFSFNSSDTSGLSGEIKETPSAALTLSPSPAKSIGHRRGASELVGGDSRFGLANVVGTSPSKQLDTLPVPDIKPDTGSPARRRGHAHRRSAAISSHDLTAILQPRDVNVQFSSGGSAPQTPTDRIIPTQYFSPPKSTTEDDSAVGAAAASPATSIAIAEEDVPTRPPSRLRVGFSENVEYIPRPLSTISSDTASSASTRRGHSLANSMSSMINLGGVGSPSPRRTPVLANSLTFDKISPSRPSDESRKSLASDDKAVRPRLQRPLSESIVSTSSSADVSDISMDPPRSSKKKTFLRLDRRRSEPLISLTASAGMGVSTISLQEPIRMDENPEAADSNGEDLHRRSSRKRVKQWASSILSRKIKDARKTKSVAGSDEQSVSGVETPDMDTNTPEQDTEEPDLDALFSQDPFVDADENGGSSIISPRMDTFPSFAVPSRGSEDASPVIDLDAALGPYGTPSMSWEAFRTTPSASRKQLHSSRLTKDFVGPGMHYHRRTESAPALVPFEFGRASSPGQSPMADVFEEEEDEALSQSTEETVDTTESEANDTEEEFGTGIEIVDAANDRDEPNFDWSFEDGLGIEGRSGHSSGLAPQRLATPPGGRRTSVVDDTIIEEGSPVEIVGDYEEPRTSSLTKSSDSSDSTVLATQNTLVLPISHSPTYPLTPTSYATSTFSSPDLSRHQESFDATRVGTSASSIGDSRTTSSSAIGEPTPDIYMSADDVPSLTSSRSTMISTMYHGNSRRDVHERPGTVACPGSHAELIASERRRKRSSIQSLSRLVGAPFGESRIRLGSPQRPQTAIPPSSLDDGKRKKENRLSKLMFWRSKSDSRDSFQSK